MNADVNSRSEDLQMSEIGSSPLRAWYGLFSSRALVGQLSVLYTGRLHSAPESTKGGGWSPHLSIIHRPYCFTARSSLTSLSSSEGFLQRLWNVFKNLNLLLCINVFLRLFLRSFCSKISDGTSMTGRTWRGKMFVNGWSDRRGGEDVCTLQEEEKDLIVRRTVSLLFFFMNSKCLTIWRTISEEKLVFPVSFHSFWIHDTMVEYSLLIFFGFFVPALQMLIFSAEVYNHLFRFIFRC